MNRNSRSESPQGKKGIFTSKIGEEKPSVIPYLNSSLQGLKQSLDGLKSMEVINQASGHFATTMIQENYGGHRSIYTPMTTLNERAIINTVTNANSNINTNASINLNSTAPHRSLTPPKVHFSYAPGQGQQLPLGSQVQYVPINQNIGPNDNIQIKKTVIPMHYYNEIPTRIIINSQAPAKQGDSFAESDEAQQVLLKQYEKLFQKMEKEHQLRIQLQETIKKMKVEIAHSNNNITSHTKLSLNIEELHKRLYKIYERAVNDIISKRKVSAKSKMYDLFTSAKKQITSFTVQEVQRVVVKNIY